MSDFRRLQMTTRVWFERTEDPVRVPELFLAAAEVLSRLDPNDIYRLSVNFSVENDSDYPTCFDLSLEVHERTEFLP